MSDIESDGGSSEPTDEVLLSDENEDQGVTDGDDAAAETDEEAGEGEAPPPKPRKTVKERIDELTWRAREAERREQALIDRLAKIGGDQSKADEAPAAAAEPEGLKKPDPSDYPEGIYDPEYVEALADWKVDQRLKAAREEEAAERAQRERLTTRDQRIKAAAEKHPDFNDVVVDGAKQGRWVCTPVMANAMASTEAEMAIAYHLAKNPDEARRIAALDPFSQVREIGRLEAKLSSDTPSTPPPKRASDAPPPPQHVRGQGGRFAVDPATDDFSAFERMADGKLGGSR